MSRLLSLVPLAALPPTLCILCIWFVVKGALADALLALLAQLVLFAVILRD